MQPISITDAEFGQFQRFIFNAAGISMADAKKALVTGRLGKRVAANGLNSFGDYFKMIASGQHPEEVQMAVDLLTTNETYFFREIKHLEFLRTQALAARHNSLHEAHHEVMECLGEMIWASQRSGLPPDGQAYIEAVRRRATS